MFPFCKSLVMKVEFLRTKASYHKEAQFNLKSNMSSLSGHPNGEDA